MSLITLIARYWLIALLAFVVMALLLLAVQATGNSHIVFSTIITVGEGEKPW